MEHNSNSFLANVRWTSLNFPKYQETEYQLEKVEYTSKALNIIFADDLNTSLDTDSEPVLFSSKRRSNSYSFGQNRGVSRIRGSDGYEFKTSSENVSFTDIFGDKTIQLENRFSFGDVDISDEPFLPSDVGKEMLLKDQEEHLKEFMYKNVDCTPCSSWTICTRRSLSGHSLLEDEQSNRKNITVGEFIGARSESLSFLPDDSFRQRVHIGCNASTPISEGEFTCNLSEMNEVVPTLSIRDQLECTALLGNVPSTPMFLFSVKKKDYSAHKYYYGSTNYKNIQRLKEEERMKASNCVDKVPLELNYSNSLAETTFGFFPGSTCSLGSEETILKKSTFEINFDSLQGKDGEMELWIVEPQELTLDVNSKGSRLRLISNSVKDLKFKTRFDSKFTNVCPISGILPAKGEIGLRVLVSRYLRGRLKEETVDTVIIISGRKEKTVIVRICKELKSKSVSYKDRSFMCF